MRFLCDHMLGTLAKWLRFLGNDVAYAGPLGDDELKALVEREGSILLTRDRELAARAAGSLCVTSDDLDAQLFQVLSAYHLSAELSMARCSVCNASLVSVPKDQVRGKVPEGVFDRQAEFWRCGACGRFYWQGTHWASMNARMREIRGKIAEPSS